MRRAGRALLTVLCVTLGAQTCAAQGVTNPDLSVIPRFRLNSSDDGAGKLQSPEISVEEFEIAIQAYLNPYARGDIFLTKAGVGPEPIEVEEAYATFVRGLPLDLNVRLGKFKSEFGKLNATHPHAWPFITTPASVARFMGDEGANDLGMGVSTLLPTGDAVYTRLNLEVLRASFVRTLDPNGTAMSGGIGLGDTLGRAPSYAYAGRLMTFLTLSDESDMELGISGLTGIHDPYRSLQFTYLNLDIKYKWKPDAYTALTIQGEALLNIRDVALPPGGIGSAKIVSRTTSGMYVYGDYQFQKMYSIGARMDWAQSPYSVSDRAAGYAVFAGFYPVEETTAFRLEYEQLRLTPAAGGAKTVRNIALQFLFSMGPHKAHPF